MARSQKPTKKGTPPPKSDYSEDAPTSIYDSGEREAKGPGSRALPDDGPGMTIPETPAARSRPVQRPGIAAPAQRAQTAPPIQAISMKTPADPNAKPIAKPERDLPHVQLRAMSEVARARQPQNLGNLAPPYDPAEARKRTVRDYVVWGSLSVILASAIALIVWFVAT